MLPQICFFFTIKIIILYLCGVRRFRTEISNSTTGDLKNPTRSIFLLYSKLLFVLSPNANVDLCQYTNRFDLNQVGMYDKLWHSTPHTRHPTFKVDNLKVTVPVHSFNPHAISKMNSNTVSHYFIIFKIRTREIVNRLHDFKIACTLRFILCSTKLFCENNLFVQKLCERIF